jgi:hypothetical protein
MGWNTIRRWMAWLMITAVSCVFVPGWAAAQPGAVQLQAAPGWGGEYKGDFVPVKVKIKNLGGAVSGKVTVRLPQNVRWGVKPVAFPVVPVELASGTEKQVTLVLSKYLARSDVRVAFVSDNQVLAEVPMGGKRLSAADKAIGVLSEDPQAASRLAGMIAGADPRIRTYPLRAQDLPESGRALTGLDVLVVHRLQTESVTSAQAEAIRQWVYSGGTLLVSGFGGAGAVKELESLLPVRPEPGEIRVNDLSALSVWGKPPSGSIMAVRSQEAEGGEILAAGDGAVLLAKRPFGSGKVLFAGYDLFDPAVSGWEGNRKLWREQLFPAEHPMYDDPNSMGVFGDIWGMMNALNQMPNLKLPEIDLLVILFLLYAVAVGPVLFWILSRGKKQEWNWLLVPMAGILVSGGLFVYGKQLRGDKVLVHQLGTVEPADGGTAMVRGMAAVLSQESGDYEVTLKDAFAWPVDPGNNVGPSRDQTIKEVAVSRDALIRFPDVPQWSKRELYLERMADLGGNLEGKVRTEGRKWTGEVTNHTRYPVRKATVLFGRTVVAVGDLAPGETRKFQATMPASPGQGVFVPENLGYRYNQREFHLLYQLLIPSPPTRLDGADVFGWVDAPLADLEVKDHRVNPAGLYFLNGKVRFIPDGQGRLVIPFGAILPEVVQADAPVHDEPQTGVFFMEQGGSMILEYRLGNQPLAEIRRLEVNTFGIPGHIYDWADRKWVPVDKLDKHPAASLVSPYQRVRIRLQVPSGKGNQINKPQIQVEGSVKR